MSSFTHSIHVFLGLPFLTPSTTQSRTGPQSLAAHRESPGSPAGQYKPATTSKFLHLETQSSASLRSTCPNHPSLPRLITSSTPSIPSPRLSSSLGLLSFRVTPDIHLTMLFSVLTSL